MRYHPTRHTQAFYVNEVAKTESDSKKAHDKEWARPMGLITSEYHRETPLLKTHEVISIATDPSKHVAENETVHHRNMKLLKERRSETWINQPMPYDCADVDGPYIQYYLRELPILYLFSDMVYNPITSDSQILEFIQPWVGVVPIEVTRPSHSGGDVDVTYHVKIYFGTSVFKHDIACRPTDEDVLAKLKQALFHHMDSCYHYVTQCIDNKCSIGGNNERAALSRLFYAITGEHYTTFFPYTTYDCIPALAKVDALKRRYKIGRDVEALTSEYLIANELNWRLWHLAELNRLAATHTEVDPE